MPGADHALGVAHGTPHLTAAHSTYIRVETAISVVINVVLTVIFVFVSFGGRSFVDLNGPGGILYDSLPQNLITVFMSLLVPTWLTRKRCTAGVIAPLGGGAGRLPANVIVRALVLAIAVAVVAVPLTWAMLPLVSPPVWGFWPLLAFKAIYSALIAALVTPLGLLVALKDPVRTGRTL
jgi:hypothetical protein